MLIYSTKVSFSVMPEHIYVFFPSCLKHIFRLGILHHLPHMWCICIWYMSCICFSSWYQFWNVGTILVYEEHCVSCIIMSHDFW